jgi:hypothetical protein
MSTGKELVSKEKRVVDAAQEPRSEYRRRHRCGIGGVCVVVGDDPITGRYWRNGTIEFVEHGSTLDYMNGKRCEAVPLVEFCDLKDRVEELKVARARSAIGEA